MIDTTRLAADLLPGMIQMISPMYFAPRIAIATRPLTREGLCAI
jgi:hypothetical protein